jgi:hypothetical protein
MNASVATVEPNGQHAAQLRPTEPGGSRTAGAQGTRFAYASGSQPLPGYTIKRGVGHGGFGEVYFAVSDAGKEVALKLIRRNLDVELRGIRHCLNLKHPNLLAIYDIRTDEQGDNWVIMEYVTGDCLEDVVVAYPNGMPVDHALAWFFGIASGVACLHDHGIVHRDLKPGNIFSDEGMVKLGDYGLSKFISCSRRSGQTESVGTVHYMAPEIANGRYGKEIDIYALGVILYEMLTGRVPFEGESVGEVLMKHLTTPPDVSMLAEPYRGVVARAMEKDPAKRFASVPEMVAALPKPAQPAVHAGPLPSASSEPGRAAGAAAARPVPAETPSATPAGGEEPILRAIRHAGCKARAAWNESPLNTPMKVLLIIAIIALLASTVHTWGPAFIMVPLAYLLYRAIRSIVLASSPPPPPQGMGGRPFAPGGVAGRPFAPGGVAAGSPAPPQPARPQAPRPTATWHRRREAAIDALVLKPRRERAAELVGSLLGSALVAIIMSVVALIVLGSRGVDFQVEQGAWLLATSLAAAWAILVPGKFWEGREGDAILRRFILMVIGLGVGALAYLAGDWFHVELPYLFNSPGPHYHTSPLFYDGDKPLILAFMAVFGSLFLVIRWWRQSDPLRATRLSIWTLIGCGFIAWVVELLWQFPLGWVMMVACVTSVAVQLASPWVHPRVRRLKAANR